MKVKKICLDIEIADSVNGSELTELITNVLETDGYSVLRSTYHGDITQEYEESYPELLHENKEGLCHRKEKRKIKFTSEPSDEFEIIETDAPDRVIEAHIVFADTFWNRDMVMPEDFYCLIKNYGYEVELIGNHEDFDDEEPEVDAVFDYGDI